MEEVYVEFGEVGAPSMYLITKLVWEFVSGLNENKCE